MKTRFLCCLAAGGLLLGLAAGIEAASGTAEGTQGLSEFTGCTELKRYLVNTAKQRAWAEVQAAPMGGGEVVFLPSAPPAMEGDGGEGKPDYSGTNVQEAGVDEPDLVKSDGDFIYLVNGGYLLVVESWPASSLSEVSRLQIEGEPVGLLLYRDLAMVVSTVWDQVYAQGDLLYPLPFSSRAKVTLVDLADRAVPTVVRELYLEGMYNTARLIGGHAHLVVSNALPVFDSGVASQLYAVPGVAAWSGAALDPVRAFGRSLMKKDLLDLVPNKEDHRMAASGDLLVETGPISPCEDFYRPDIPSGPNTISIVTLDLGDPQANLHSVTVVSDNGEVYAAADSLYVAAINYGVWYWQAVESGEQESSVIHKFTLGAAPAYAATGKVAGWIVNRYAMSEHEGALRIATTTNMWNWDGSGPRNQLYVMTQNGDQLAVTATLGGLGHEGERIYAVRYDGDRGYLVTFRQTDPLYTLDLSDPAAPRVAGELEVPGFSTYLHPVGDGYLLAIGQNTEMGGGDLSLYDVRDPEAPALVDREWLGEGSWSEAMYEPKAFTYFDPLKQLALPLQQWYYPAVAEDGTVSPEPVGFNGSVVFDVDFEQGLERRGAVDHSEYADPWGWTSSVVRNLYIGDDGGYALYSLSQAALKASDADTLEEIAGIELPGNEDWYGPVVYAGDPVAIE